MFRNRQSSQKPPDELFERFRSTFPGVRSTTGGEEAGQTSAIAGGVAGGSLEASRFGSQQEDLDPTPRAPAEPFRFTPSLLDPNSAAFAAFVNQTPGLFTPTPGGANAVFGSGTANPVTTQQHELQTPNIGITIGSPLSMSNNATIPPPTTDSQFATPQTIQPHQFHNFPSFSTSLHSQFLDPTHYDAVAPESGPGSPMDTSGAGDLMQRPIGLDGAAVALTSGPLSVPLDGEQFENQLSHDMTMLPTERFRFHVVLNAPTAMIKNAEEIPVTYLNKGQAYAVSIADTMPPPPGHGPVRYRTYIRISFHDETQRARPGACWQLWKEGRGTSEAHQRGGKLQAVEYVENTSSGDEEKKKKAKVELESSSFDGFCVTWSPSLSGNAETSVSVRFNFLSTDFSHSKGVKGIPVRLCAKTEVLSAESPSRASPEATEICYCKVKLFRDHGAERKLANDVLHVKKTIEKLRQQASQMEGTGMKLFGKKSRKDGEELSKPGKVPKHKRTWSMSSASSVTGGRSQEDDTNAKLQSMQDMFSSTKPISMLYLRGEDEDDPDLYPVRLAGDSMDPDDAWAGRRLSIATNTTASSFVSPTPSSASLRSQSGDHYSSPEKDWVNRGYGNLAHSGPPEVPVRISKTSDDPGMLSGWIEAIGIDSSYIPPVEKPAKAVMCIYILPMVAGETQNAIHRAVYLSSRTADCLTNSIAAKCGIDSTAVVRTVHLNPRGITVLVDDEFVLQMNEGQDMKVQATEIQEAPLSQEWVTTDMNDEDVKPPIESGWELALIY